MSSTQAGPAGLSWRSARVTADATIVVERWEGGEMPVLAPHPARARSAPLPRGLLWFGEEFALLEFDAERGGRRIEAWVLSASGKVLDVWHRNLAEAQVARIRGMASRFLKPVLRRLATRVDAAAQCADTQALLRLGPDWRDILLEVTEAAWQPGTEVRLADVLRPKEPSRTKLPETLIASAERVRRIFGHDPRPMVHEAIVSGRLAFPALSHDGMAAMVRPVQTDPDWCVLQIRDREAGPDWLVIFRAALMSYSVEGIVIAEDDIVICRNLNLLRHARRALGRLQSTLLATGLPLAQWEPQARGISVATRSRSRNHIGHLVWNVYTGIETALTLDRRRPSPGLVVHDLAGAAGDSPYGPLLRLFPELDGRIRLSETKLAEAFAASIAADRHMLPMVESRIPLVTRRRLLKSIAEDHNAMTVARLAQAAAGEGAPAGGIPLLVLGIRLQNRTMPDLMQFYARLVRRLHKAAGASRFAVFLDGLNTSQQGGEPKLSDALNVSAVLERENAFAAGLRRELADVPVTIFNGVGLTLLNNLAVLSSACCFVAPNGAGLVKLRWVHRIPGFVLTSAQSLRFGPLVDCYGEYVEVEEDAPAPLHYTRPEEVEDLHPDGETFDEEGRAASGWRGGMSVVNFRLRDEAAVTARIEVMFLQAMGITRATPAARDILTGAAS